MATLGPAYAGRGLCLAFLAHHRSQYRSVPSIERRLPSSVFQPVDAPPCMAKRIITEVEVGLLIRAAPSKRDRVLLEVIYAGGLRVSETVALTWSDVLPRDDRGAVVDHRQGRQGARPCASILGCSFDEGD